VIAEVLAGIGEGFEGFVFGGCHAEGGLADLGGENGKFAGFFDAAFFPLVGKDSSRNKLIQNSYCGLMV
jgi:hypothetical protein